MSLNSFAINSTPINAGASSSVGSGTIVSLEQKVVVKGSGTIIPIEQDVQLRSVGSGTIVTPEQTVRETFSGNLIILDQTVRDLTDTTASHLVRTGWDLDVYIGGEKIDRSLIMESTSVDFTSGNSALASVVLKGQAGSQDLEYYDGKSVFIVANTYSSSNNPKITTDSKTRVFTGIVAIAEFDIIRERIILNCVNERRKLINDNLSKVVPTIGLWSKSIFDSYKDTADYLDQRISTVRKSLDFDGYNKYSLYSWTPKGTADISLSGSGIYARQPVIKRTDASRIVNKTIIKMQYRYQRLHHRQKSVQWTSPIDNNPCRILAEGYTMTRRDMVIEAVRSAGWVLRGDISFVNPPAAGWYSCNGVYAALSYTNTTARLEARTDIDGNAVSDSEGNPIYDPVTTNVTTYNDAFCAGASWVATKRWTQGVTEERTITLNCPQSQSQFGTVTREQTFGVQANFNTANWENYTRYTNLGLGTTYFIDQDYNSAEYTKAVRVAMEKAKTEMLDSHRDTRVIIQIPFYPDIKLGHTIETTATRINCKGLVESYTHTFNHETTEAMTEITILLSRVSGSTTDQSLAIPARLNTDSAPSAGGVINLGNHFGEDPSQSGAENWNGMIGNRVVNGILTKYPVAFIVDMPAIEDSVRSNKTLSGTTSYNVEIPNNTLTITFEGSILE